MFGFRVEATDRRGGLRSGLSLSGSWFRGSGLGFRVYGFEVGV